MSTFKMTDVVMLATNQKAENQLVLDIVLGKLILATRVKNGNKLFDTNSYDNDYEFQHLYFLSDEEIKEDNFYYNGKYIEKATKELMPLNNGVNKKIITTTDKSLRINVDMFDDPNIESTLPLPQPSQSFLEVFVKEYNKGNQIKKVMVEYEEGKRWLYTDGKGKEHGELQLKIKKDNTITIREVKDSWTREEVIDICYKYKGHILDMQRVGRTESESQWFEKNL